MKTILKLVIICTLLLSNVSFVFAQQNEEKIIQKIDSLLADAFEKGIFSGLVVMSHNGKEFYFKNLGFADWKSKKPIERNTLFNICSLNKQFTAEIIHQLVKENKLAYEDKLNKYLDLFPTETGSKITIQQLLDMRAGLGDYLLNPKFVEIQHQNFTVSDLMKIIKKEPLIFEPGTSQRYSNSGYVVLGAIIEKITGQSYEENLRERIMKPLGLKNIFYAKTEKEKQNTCAKGTLIDFEGNKINSNDISNSTPAGGIYTNVDDLLIFAEAKRNSALPSGKKYGNGINAGGTPDWNSVIYFNEKNAYSFVVMANTGSISDEISRRLNSIIKGERYPPLELPFTMTLAKIIQEKGIDYVKANVEKLANQARLPYDDRFLNFFGYQFLEANRTDIAIKLLAINVELFPNIPNSYDSLAEAYLKAGDKVNALKNYRLEFEKSPNNPTVKKIISDLENENK